MTKIKKLSTDEIKKIAAGEVVERPANVLKELVENSIDANANQITIYIENSGKKLIQIVDNGSGMIQEDAKICFEHHATSKISNVEDLNKISSFGFRGEALSSIASVSKIKLSTKTENNALGVEIILDQSKIINEKQIPSNTGTDIAIQDLFFNVPVRKKFLKSNETEWRAIVQLFTSFALCHNNIFFKLYHNQKLIHSLPATTDIFTRIKQIYDPYFTENSLQINKNFDNFNLSIDGVISNPKYSRYDRSKIYFFVNQRWIKNFTLSKAILKGYQNILEKNKFPAAFIFIKIDPNLVDINIHPRKEEVRFLNPKIVENFITQTVKEKLEEYVDESIGQKTKTLPKINQFNSALNLNNFDIQKEKYSRPFESIEIEKEITTESSSQKNDPSNLEKENFNKIIENSFENQKNNQQFSLSKETSSQEIIDQNPQNIPFINQKLNFKLVGQILKTYIIIEIENQITLIDQHAAHERIMYELLKNNFKNPSSIKLLFSQIISLSQEDLNTVLPYLNLLKKFGIIIEQISKEELAVKETPIYLKNQSFEDTINQIIGTINQNKNLEIDQIQKIILEKIHAQLSCKAAIKAGDKLTNESMNELINKLYETENKLTCPHGRPTIHNLSKTEIEKKFKRDYK